MAPTGSERDVRRVDPDEAHALVQGEGYVYVDVRTPTEFAAGRPAGALNVPSEVTGPRGLVPNEEFVAVCAALFPRERPLVIGCERGVRSLRAAGLLEAAGFTQVVEQRAGFAGVRDGFGRVVERGWAARGLPVERGEGPNTYAALRDRVRGGDQGAAPA